MKKLFLTVLLSLSLLSVLFAAGRQGAGGSGTTASTATGVIGNNLKYDLSAPVNGGRNITIEFWTVTEYLRVQEKLAAEYSQIHPNVKINITVMANDDFWQKLPLALQTGTGPDIFHMTNEKDDVVGPYLAPYPEDVLPLAALRADFDQVDPHIQNGKLYYIDTGVMTSGIFYNKKMWREAGLTEADIPTSWDQLIQVAKKLTVYDQSGNITREGFSINSNEQFIFEALALQRGRFLFDANNKPVVNNDVWKQNLKFVQDFFTVHKTSSIQFPVGHEALVNEQGAMAYVWSWVGSWLINYPNVEWGVFNLPSWDGKPAPAYDRNNGLSSFSVSNVSRKEAQAVGFDILKYYLCKDDLLVEMDMLLNMVPTKKSLKNDPTLLSNVVLGTLSNIIDRTIWPGAVPTPYFNTINTYAVEAVLFNNASIDAALAETQAMLDRDFVQTFPNFKSTERQYAHANEMR